MTESNFTDKPASNIFFLIGFMGSGKSMLSRGVKQSLNLITVEMDEEIEAHAEMSINEIFAAQGEEGFRILERTVLHDLIRRFRNSSQVVLISTGGGVPCFFDNMDVMKAAGKTIFINPSIERLSTRLENRNSERPLIKGKNLAQIKEYVSLNLKKRLPFYTQAHIQMNTVYEDKALNIQFLKDIILAEELLEA